MSLEDILKNQHKKTEPINAPKGYEKSFVEVGSDSLDIVTVPEATDADSPAEANLENVKDILRKNGLNPDAWILNSFAKSKWQKAPDSWMHSFKISAKPSGKKFGVELPSFDSIVNSIEKIEPRSLPETFHKGESVVVNIADPQVGKVDYNGGTKEFLVRNRESMLRVIQYLEKVQPEEIILADLGDAFEGFENTAQQSFTNDLSHPDQIEVWGQVFFEWIETVAKLARKVVVISVPSNHTAWRKGKDYLGRPGDDYGLTVHKFLEDRAGMRPDLYGHVSFEKPGKWEESLTYTTLSGIGVGFVHGHQFNQIARVDDWWAGQTHGDCPLALAKILNFGHHHHLHIQEGRGGKFIFGSPSSDGGSAWIRNLKGVSSKAGVLLYSVDAEGPYDWAIL